MSKIKSFIVTMIILLVIVITCFFGFHESEKVVLNNVNEIQNEVVMDNKYSIDIDKTPIKVENEDGYTYL